MELIMTRATPSDWDFIREVRNASSSGFSSQGAISPDKHKAFMEKCGGNYFIARRGNHKIGFIGEVEGDIRFAIAPSFRGKSLASSMLIVFQEKVTDKMLSGKVKTTNPASIKTFLKAGWKKNPATQLIGGEEYIIFEK